MILLRPFLASLSAALLLTGCASTYIPPGARADLQAFTADPEIKKAYAAKPANPFPAAVAIVRIQAAKYENYYTRANGGVFGSGRYTVVTAKDIEEQSQLDRIARLQDITDIVTLNRMLIPSQLNDDQGLRVAAARLHADLTLVYTFDTSFYDTNASVPLSVITLGLAPTNKIRAVSTASALLLDTHTGYVYSTYEATEKEDTIATSWDTSETADRVRRKVEKAAFDKLANEFAKTWSSVLARYKK